MLFHGQVENVHRQVIEAHRHRQLSYIDRRSDLYFAFSLNEVEPHEVLCHIRE
jgi:hypothetical protein